jgi:hypothetical protein
MKLGCEGQKEKKLQRLSLIPVSHRTSLFPKMNWTASIRSIEDELESKLKENEVVVKTVEELQLRLQETCLESSDIYSKK